MSPGARARTASEIDRYARLVAATVSGTDARAALLEREALDEAGAAQLQARSNAALQGPDARLFTTRFSVAYRAALKGEEPPPFEDPSAPAPEGAPPSGPPAAVAPPDGAQDSEACPALATTIDAGLETTLPVERPHAAVMRPAVPFVAQADHSLGFEVYASYQADLAVWPERAEEVFARYGLSDRKRRNAVHATWAERLKDPATLAKWEALVEQLVAAKRKPP